MNLSKDMVGEITIKVNEMLGNDPLNPKYAFVLIAIEQKGEWAGGDTFIYSSLVREAYRELMADILDEAKTVRDFDTEGTA